ncbi:MAG TPA: Imm8 family immunity protein [Solirubrobacteraceae bacterium]|nr:Imm8 family immunity protein [Solirubrobacteraceae bacterium]
MKAELRRLHSPDVDDLRTWIPDDAEFALLVQAMVGPSGSPGEESFDLTVCTGGWLAARAEAIGVVDARHHLVVAEYSYDDIESYLARRINACEAAAWPAVAALVGRIGQWEFEDYKE